MKRVTAIARKTLRMILEASRDMYPREFGAILRAEEGIITELILVPGTVSGKRHAIFQLHTLPADFSVWAPSTLIRAASMSRRTKTARCSTSSAAST